MTASTEAGSIEGVGVLLSGEGTVDLGRPKQSTINIQHYRNFL